MLIVEVLTGVLVVVSTVLMVVALYVGLLGALGPSGWCAVIGMDASE